MKVSSILQRNKNTKERRVWKTNGTAQVFQRQCGLLFGKGFEDIECT